MGFFKKVLPSIVGGIPGTMTTKSGRNFLFGKQNTAAKDANSRMAEMQMAGIRGIQDEPFSSDQVADAQLKMRRLALGENRAEQFQPGNRKLIAGLSNSNALQGSQGLNQLLQNQMGQTQMTQANNARLQALEPQKNLDAYAERMRRNAILGGYAMSYQPQNAGRQGGWLKPIFTTTGAIVGGKFGGPQGMQAGGQVGNSTAEMFQQM